MEKQAFDRLKLINSLIKIAHSDKKDKSEKAKIQRIYDTYSNIGLQVVKTDPELFAHIVSWNHKKSKIFDSKVAFPIIALRGDSDFSENAISHLCSLGPRELNRSYYINKKFVENSQQIKNQKRKTYVWGMNKYLEVRENNRKWLDKCLLQHRKTMKNLYKNAHRKPPFYVQNVLFNKKYPNGSVFDIISKMKNMSSKEAAGHILNFKIPFPVAIGAVPNVKNEYILLALINSMTANELQNNSRMLEKLGVMGNPTLRSAFDEAIERSKKDKKANIYKASKAKTVISNEKMKEKLVSVQKEKEKKQEGLKGDWLIHCDVSSSMDISIEPGKKVAGLLASQVRGKIYLIFANDQPRFYDVTGMDYDQISEKTKNIRAYGGTSLGCGLDYLIEKDLNVQGMVVISDGEDWAAPMLYVAVKKFGKTYGFIPNIYHLYLRGGRDVLNQDYIQKIDINDNFDEYVFPNLLNILKTNKYSLTDEIMDCPLLTFDQVFKKESILV